MKQKSRFQLFFIVSMFLVVGLCVVSANAYDLDDPTEPWRTSNTGVLIDAVPPPFENLIRSGNDVSMWGRTYTMGSLLPSQIVNQGTSMFAAPAKVLVRISGVTYELDMGSPAFGLERNDRIEFTGSQAVGATGVTVSAVCWVEYDGVMRIDLTLSPGSPVSLPIRASIR